MSIGIKLKNINEENNFFYLTLALIVLLIGGALAKAIDEVAIELILQLFTIITFIVCFASLRFDKTWSRFLYTLAGVWVFAIVIKAIFHIQEMNVVTLALTFAFFFGTFKSIARQILFTGHINSNKVIGSVALFLLLGLMWAIAYLILLEFSPQSFTGMEAISWGENFSNAAYFSFVTLTTLGYGDISPLTPLAQVIVYLEAITGVFYMAIVVSSLVSSNIDNQVDKNE
ncbi:potassium channel family protein [Vibrio alginolyticus]|uniref:potassium channel family protein n=1 Tax=Vibrio sp. B1FLJ16 TaxID=2751178 RepID=UPI0015F4883D|nr:potassium channel family protein [Vibrio sp. B1FLJ16]CAD7822151.1 Ion channel [Vibrio sp. B1FLJ16]CAD7823711.1 Ion channel [Vibrio sp. B1FLJ16]CAE6948214.1 Ion channel [Vibrio sp. B1FLJ16]CAE6952576.1 Ion channel [Vibrio sp. B1FLJ16]